MTKNWILQRFLYISSQSTAKTIWSTAKDMAKTFFIYVKKPCSSRFLQHCSTNIAQDGLWKHSVTQFACKPKPDHGLMQMCEHADFWKGIHSWLGLPPVLLWGKPWCGFACHQNPGSQFVSPCCNQGFLSLVYNSGFVWRPQAWAQTTS